MIDWTWASEMMALTSFTEDIQDSAWKELALKDLAFFIICKAILYPKCICSLQSKYCSWTWYSIKYQVSIWMLISMWLHLNGPTLLIQIHANSLNPGGYGSNFASFIFILIIQNGSLCTQCEFALWWTLQNLTDEESRAVPDVTKPLPEQMLTQIYVAIWHH